MVAFTKLICERQTRIHLTHGEVIGDSNMFTTTNFRTNETQRHRPSFMDAHGDGDMGVIREFVRSVSHRLAKGNNQTSENVDSADDVGYPVSEVLRSHLAVFCAERARRTGTVVLFEDYERESLVMADVCTNNPTQTVFATSTSQATTVTRSTTESLSVVPGSVVTRSTQSGTGTEWIIVESTAPGTTQTVQVEVPVTITGEQQVITAPVSTLYAPCSTSTTSTTSTSTTPTTTTTSTSTSTTPTSTSTTPTSTETTPTTTQTTESRTTTTTEQTTSPTSRTSEQQNNNTTPTTTAPTPTPTPPPNTQGGNSASQTGTLTTISSFSTTTLPNGSQSTATVIVTSSIPPSGGLNGNDSGSSGGGSSTNSTRAVAIGVGVTGGVIALIILIFGITWHIRRKRRNAIPLPLDESDIWGTHHEAKTPPHPSLAVHNPNPNLGPAPGYTYNPYGEVRTTGYAPVPTTSPPRARPMILAESDDNRLSAGSYGTHPVGAGPTAPLLGRTQTADEILYAAARQDLPKSRASSATASHHTRPSETGVSSYRQKTSFAASHKTHGSSASRASGSAVGLLDHPARDDATEHETEHELERPTSPVSIAAPRLAIVNPDVDKDL
ncbi:unnamed protein product [Rhizoctonia solani]|uniref:Uncharacterized protein n=1 Tax=Rhizoctonia solani TaxID=456999 RepID=A0A8H3ANG5_9AGAM|nr:unnamed protein product [Rhizoctonia solani]